MGERTVRSIWLWTALIALVVCGSMKSAFARGGPSPDSNGPFIVAAVPADEWARAEEALKKQPEEAVRCYERALAIMGKGDDLDQARAFSGLGEACRRIGRYDRALEHYGRALAAARASRDVKAETCALNGAGEASAGLRQFNEARHHFEEALALARRARDGAGEARALIGYAAVAKSIRQLVEALGFYQEALAVARRCGDRTCEGRALNGLGDTQWMLSRSDEAVACHEAALRIWNDLGDRWGEGNTLGLLGNAFWSLGEYEKAIAFYESSLSVTRQVKVRRGEAISLHNLGYAYANLDQYEKAIEYLEQASTINRDMKNRAGEGRTLSVLGSAYHLSGQAERAVACCGQALLIARELKDRPSEGIALKYLGDAYQDLSQYEKAISCYEQALVIGREVGDRQGQGAVLGDLAFAYHRLNRYEKATAYYEQSLAMCREVKDRHGEAAVLNNLGRVYHALGQHQKAVACFEQALAIHRQIKYRRGQATALVNMSEVLASVGEYEKAVQYDEQALAIAHELRSRHLEAVTVGNLGHFYLNLGQHEKATSHFEQALSIFRGLKDRDSEGRVLSWLMTGWARRTRPRVAIFYGKLAINAWQEIRADLGSLDRSLQQSFLKNKTRSYRDLADLLISEGRLPEAQQVIDLLKEEELREFVRRDASMSAGGNLTLTPDETRCAQGLDGHSSSLIAQGEQLRALEAKKNRTPDEERRRQELEKMREANALAFQQYLQQVGRELGESQKAGRQAATLESAEPLQAELEKMNAGTVILYTLVEDDKMRVLLITPKLYRSYTVPITLVDLRTRVASFREALRNPRTDPRPAGKQLYDLLIGPELARDLDAAKATTLMWSLDGPLRYVPLAALHDGRRYLVEHYRLSVLTVNSRDHLTKKPSASWKVAGLGVSRAHGKFPELPAVPAELRAIVRDPAVSGAAGPLPGIILLDDRFTEAAYKDAVKLYPVVHVASHFDFLPGDETRSSLLLGDGQQIDLPHLRTIPLTNVELLTLSACNTASGSEGADGREVEGFAAIAQKKGAHCVIATLWPVADESTAALMQSFYAIRQEHPELPKVEALRRAQVAMLNGDRSLASGRAQVRGARLTATNARPPGEGAPARFKTDPARPCAHPYYWAPFILMGNGN